MKKHINSPAIETIVRLIDKARYDSMVNPELQLKAAYTILGRIINKKKNSGTTKSQ